MTHPLTGGSAPGEWRDDKQERRLVSLAEKRLAEAVARIAELEAALRPFANVVYNDNSDVTLSFSHLRQEDYMRARKAVDR